ncbi:hypothetical protein JCM33374_g2492 [Metschnikowia sp. JCM 33374]|nr:hypothetical protein JCM33374_g2492 [Metschnikowia sp. JCM 33374]
MVSPSETSTTVRNRPACIGEIQQHPDWRKRYPGRWAPCQEFKEMGRGSTIEEDDETEQAYAKGVIQQENYTTHGSYRNASLHQSGTKNTISIQKTSRNVDEGVYSGNGRPGDPVTIEISSEDMDEETDASCILVLSLSDSSNEEYESDGIANHTSEAPSGTDPSTIPQSTKITLQHDPGDCNGKTKTSTRQQNLDMNPQPSTKECSHPPLCIFSEETRTASMAENADSCDAITKYTCTVCPKDFSSADLLISHLRSHSGENPYGCTICHRKFSTPSLLIVHLDTQHIRRESESTPESQIGPYFQSDHLVTFKRRRKESTPINFDVIEHESTNVIRTSSKAETRIPVPSEMAAPSRKCAICNLLLWSEENLDSHMRVHAADKPYQCAMCDKKYTSKQMRDRHTKTHTEGNCFQCKICGKQLSCTPKLTQHLRSHTGIKVFECEICGKEISTKERFADHLATHKAQKPYKCPVCPSRLSSKAALNTHHRSHTKEKPQCPVCEKVLSSISNLNQHMTLHRGDSRHKCLICQRRFTRKSGLADHARTHH